jgi:acyl-CoA thioesterase FadM
MLVKAVVEWVGSAGFDEWIDIGVAPTRIGTKSFDLSYRAAIDGRDVCTATITYCAVRPGLNQPFAIPDPVRVALTERLCQ